MATVCSLELAQEMAAKGWEPYSVTMEVDEDDYLTRFYHLRFPHLFETEDEKKISEENAKDIAELKAGGESCLSCKNYSPVRREIKDDNTGRLLTMARCNHHGYMVREDDMCKEYKVKEDE